MNKALQKGRIRRSQFRVKKVHYLKLIVKGFFLNFINVGLFIFWATIVIIVNAKLDFNTYKIAIYFTYVIGTCFVFDLIKIVLAKQVKKKLTRRRLIMVKQITGIIIIAFGIGILVKSFF